MKDGQKMELRLQNNTSILIIYGLTHAIVDASCIILILGGIDVRGDLLQFILLYNICAFGLQLPFGWVNDKLHKPILTAFAGCLIIAVGLVFFINPYAATILAGTGNALFHVGGGTVSLNLKPGKAALPGVFVAFGGIGLFAGGLSLKYLGFHPMFLVILLLSIGLCLLIVKKPLTIYKYAAIKTGNFLALAILLFMITIAFRSAVGMAIDFPWKSKTVLVVCLTLGIAFGKGFGGFIADSLGWTKTAVVSLAISAILLYFGFIPLAGILGIFLFNITMPITLVAISNLLPGRPGFSFGLTTMALLLGSLPTFFHYKNFLSQWSMLAILAGLSTILLFVGLRIYNRNI